MNNLAELLKRHLATPDRVLYRQYVDEQWRDFTAAEVAALAARWQQAFRNQGFERGDRVALCLKNSVQWVAIDMAALGMGLTVVPLYINDNAQNIGYCVDHSESRLLVLENPRMLETLRRSLTGNPIILCLQAEPADAVTRVEDWLPRESGGFEVAELEPDYLATIVYTSGTTGRPKGAKLSHHNILCNVEATLQMVELHDDDLLISILPLSHMFERTCGYYLALQRGLAVAYARGIQQLGEDLAAVRPTILIAVPRVFERFLARIEQNLADSAVKRRLFDLTVKYGWRCYLGEAGALERLAYGGLRKIVADKIMAKLGGRMRLTVVGGAAVEARIAQTFIGLGLHMMQGYGLTEASPVVTANREGDKDPSAVGTPLPGLEVRVNDSHELLVRGPSVMLGYWRNPEATAAVLDNGGWLNTGDQAELVGGRYYIKGRSKDILVLSNGEKLPPDTVETAILDDKVFEQVMLVGEGRAFVSLVAVTQEMDEKKLVKRANDRLKDFPKWVRVRRIVTDKEPWTIENGLLTPTMKVKRAEVYARYKNQIERIYTNARGVE
ncbi:MAG: AMP-binding protein [Betaproteobacteria bacterium]|nr:AMP-binding protein [Betaproteobacteria bacterium]